MRVGRHGDAGADGLDQAVAHQHRALVDRGAGAGHDLHVGQGIQPADALGLWRASALTPSGYGGGRSRSDVASDGTGVRSVSALARALGNRPGRAPP